MKKRRYQIAALMMSIIIATGSLSGSVFAAENSGDTTELSVVEEIEESERSETEDENEEEQNQSVPEEKLNNNEEKKKEYSADIQTKETNIEETNEEEKDEEFSVKKEDFKFEKDAVTPSLDIGENRETENPSNEELEDEIIPEKTVKLYLGSGVNTLEYEHDDALGVQFEVDPDLKMDYLICDGNYTFTTITSEIRILPLGVGNGTIKVIDSNSNKVIFIINVVIEPSDTVEEITICKGTYEWTDVWFVTSPFLDWNVSDGVSIKIKDTEEDNGFFLDDDTNYPISFFHFVLAVEGKQIGDYSVSFYSGSEDDIYSTVIYHVVDHDYQDSNVQKEVSCEENGIIEKICKNCGNKVTEEIPATGHIWNEDYTVDKEATCTEEGSESIHCSVCGEIDEETVRSISKKEHAYADWTTTKEATCSEEGSKEKVCTDCGDKVTETIPATGHIWNEDYTVDKEATCTEEGSESIHCSVCDVIQDGTSRTIPKTAHEYGDWTVTKEATCTEAGTKEKTCKDCNDKVTETIPATGHTWNEDYTVDKEATYTKEGSESIHCSICGEIKEGSSRPIARLLKPMSMLAVSGIVDKTYTGDALIQEIVIQDGTEKLKNGTDYIVSYSNNRNAGTAIVNITGLGHYTGEISKTFTIAKATQNLNILADPNMILVGKTTNVKASGAEETSKYSFSSSDPAIATVDSTGTVTGKAAGTATITVRTAETPNYKASSKTVVITVNEIVISGYSDKIYNGQPQTQTPVIKVNGTALTEGVDYSVSYSNNVNAGKATMTITGIGLYEGITTSTSFTIAKAAQNCNVKAGASNIEIGKTTKVTASGAKETPKFTFTSSNTKVATVDAAGTVTGKAAGTVTITVKAAATANYKELSKTVKITVNKVLKKPGNCHFTKWNNSKYTSCRISWNKVDGAEGYQTLLSWTDGSHSSATIVKSNVLYRDCTVHPQHVSQMKVRAFYTLNGQRKYGPWSNVEYITPSPAKLTTKNASSGSNLKMNISWNIIYGCNGYNVFITTNPNGKWYWNQSTTEKATATSASIDKCGGAKLKKNTRYYVRIVTRRKRNGVFCTVPMPANNTYIGSFVIK